MTNEESLADHGSPDDRYAYGRIPGALLALGALFALPLALLHPSGIEPETILGFEPWTSLHLSAAVGFSLFAVAALLQLADRRGNGLTGLGLAGMVFGATVAALTLAMDGFLNPVLAAAAVDGETALRTVLVEIERSVAVLGYGGFGLAGATIMLSYMGKLNTGLRVVSGVVTLAFLAVAGAGILYLGMGLDGLGILFLGMPVAMGWLLFVGASQVLRGTAGPVGSKQRAPAGQR